MISIRLVAAPKSPAKFKMKQSSSDERMALAGLMQQLRMLDAWRDLMAPERAFEDIGGSAVRRFSTPAAL
ncbi:hypothetical protein [Falsiroseomonas selenitidurans]|uniref:Transposase n=1 Tax=Falsiroseomonas selenitidurans TaxID=2716335 RepID=A0ABX1E776_9PROT|nr:hypothetical protein [Falsiroseomonas selenitidurans]NKC32823.1 hypothetical protein [Falsiroseomonas selenitidurans]